MDNANTVSPIWQEIFDNLQEFALFGTHKQADMVYACIQKHLPEVENPLGHEKRIATYIAEEAKQELAFLTAVDDLKRMMEERRGHRDKAFKMKTWAAELGIVVVMDYPDCRGYESDYHMTFEDAFIDAVNQIKADVDGKSVCKP